MNDDDFFFMESCRLHAEAGGYMFEHIRQTILRLIKIIEKQQRTDYKDKLETGV